MAEVVTKPGMRRRKALPESLIDCDIHHCLPTSDAIPSLPAAALADVP